MIEPSVKGIALQPGLARIHDLVDRGKLAPEELSFRLSEEALELVETGVQPFLWYPIRLYDELLRLLVEQLGGGDIRYLAEMAQESAVELLSAQPYNALVDDAQGFGDRAGVVLIKLSQLIFNFARWSYAGENLVEFTVTVDDAGSLPETARHSASGFMAALASLLTGKEIHMESQRESADRIVYRAGPAGASSPPAQGSAARPPSR